MWPIKYETKYGELVCMHSLTSKVAIVRGRSAIDISHADAIECLSNAMKGSEPKYKQAGQSSSAHAVFELYRISILTCSLCSMQKKAVQDNRTRSVACECISSQCGSQASYHSACCIWWLHRWRRWLWRSGPIQPEQIAQSTFRPESRSLRLSIDEIQGTALAG